MGIRTFGLWLAVGAAAISGAPAAARQEQSDEARQSRWSALLNVDLMVNTYTRFLVRKYDLTGEQEEFTRQLLAQRAHEFLDAHRPDVTRLVDRLFEVRGGGDMSHEELVEWGKQVLPLYQEAKKAIIEGNAEWREILTDEQRAIHDEDLKLMHESFGSTETQLERIVTGQMDVDEFRRPLRSQQPPRRGAVVRRRAESVPPPVRSAEPATPETEAAANGDGATRIAGGVNVSREASRAEPPVQPISPDSGTQPPPEPAVDEEARAAELRQLQEAAAQAEMQRAAEGAGGSGEAVGNADRRRPGPQPGATGPKRPAPAGAARGANAKSAGSFASEWEQYTRQFIERYQLNEAQSEKAWAICADCTSQGERLMKARTAQIEALDRELAEVSAAGQKEGADRKALLEKTQELTERRKKLREPIDQIFERQLKPRLEKLPTRAQRKAAEASSKSPGKVEQKKD